MKGKWLCLFLLLFALAYARNYGAGPYGSALYGVRSGTISFSMELNVNGSANDTAEADGLGNGYYRANNITNYYACVQDTAIQNSPVYGLVFSGRGFDYINLTANLTQGNSFRIAMSQNLTGNKFIIPITKTGCSVLRNKFADIRSFGYLPSAYVPFSTAKNPLEVSISFPGIDLVGDFSKTGAFKILLEKNETDSIVQITATP